MSLTPASTGLTGLHSCGQPYRWVRIPKLVFNRTRTKVITRGEEWAIWCDTCDTGGIPAIPVAEEESSAST